MFRYVRKWYRCHPIAFAHIVSFVFYVLLSGCTILQIDATNNSLTTEEFVWAFYVAITALWLSIASIRCCLMHKRQGQKIRHFLLSIYAGIITLYACISMLSIAITAWDYLFPL